MFNMDSHTADLFYKPCIHFLYHQKSVMMFVHESESIILKRKHQKKKDW